MDPSETNKFEDQWKKAFEEASETPPPSVWEGIEARLDRDEDEKIIPFWWRSAKLWYAAASVTALVLVGAGIWYNMSRNLGKGNEKIEIATTAISGNRGKKDAAENLGAGNPVRSSKSDHARTFAGNTIAGAGAAEVAAGKVIKKDRGNKYITDEQTVFLSKAEKYAAESKAARQNEVNSTEKTIPGATGDLNVREDKNKMRPDSNGKVDFSAGEASRENDATEKSTGILESAAAFRENQNNMNSTAGESFTSVIAASMLAPLPYKELSVFIQKRYVFVKPGTQPTADPAEVKKPKEYWAGIGLMPASFNPDVKIKESPMAFAGQLASRQKSLTGSNEAGTSFALQTQGGVRFSKHWSVELGLSYLQGNARYLGGGYVLNAYNNASSNVLQDALSGLANADKSAGVASPGFANTSNTTLYIDVNKKVSNDYRYLQLPLQAGFTFNPNKKLSYSVLGGMMANFFLANELESATGEIITTTAGDDIYRSINWAATTGLRFNYKLSSKWKASLTGSYQKAITSGFRANQSLESHPYLYGVSWGVRYSF